MDRTARIFISYRRSDTKWAAGRLYDRLAAVLGSENVFLDVTNIEPGIDFVQAIKEVVGTCDVLLALVGERWLSAVGDRGKRNIDSARDLVRVEIAAALERNIRVIPILIDNATLPEEDELPSDVASLARRNARQISFESFHGDVDSFIRVLEHILAGPAAQPKTVAETKQEHRETGEKTAVVTTLPFTIALETLGGVATPLIRQGSKLPAQASDTFSTAADNQPSVEIKLWAGERSKAVENVLLGTFTLGGIEPAARAVPQIQLRATVDPSLVMVVTAEDLKNGRKQVLDAVDLSHVQVPPSAMVPDPAAAEPDSPHSSGSGFADIFKEFFGNKTTADPNPGSTHTEVQLSISRSEADTGVEKVIDTPEGEKLRVKIPPKIKSGTRLRITGRGPQLGCETCHATGSTGQDTGTCPQCDGKGKVTKKAGAMNFNLTCPSCDGSGKLRNPCPTCGGDGKVRGDLYVAVTVTQ